MPCGTGTRPGWRKGGPGGLRTSSLPLTTVVRPGKPRIYAAWRQDRSSQRGRQEAGHAEQTHAGAAPSPGSPWLRLPEQIAGVLLDAAVESAVKTDLLTKVLPYVYPQLRLWIPKAICRPNKRPRSSAPRPPQSRRRCTVMAQTSPSSPGSSKIFVNRPSATARAHQLFEERYLPQLTTGVGHGSAWQAAVRARLRGPHAEQARFIASPAPRKMVRAGRRGQNHRVSDPRGRRVFAGQAGALCGAHGGAGDQVLV